MHTQSILGFQKINCQNTFLSDTTIVKKYNGTKVPINIKHTNGAIGNILVLPGWNFKATEWCEKTELCALAEKFKFNLVFVEMQKSVYLKNYYPQTRIDFTKFPTRTWLYDSVYLELLKSNLIPKKIKNFVMGLSTGGRGAAIMALEYPILFSGAATLSGDFDPSLQKNDNLMIISLGPYLQNKKLWEGDNNITKRAKELVVPIYVGHGKADKVSPATQSINFVNKLKKENKSLTVISHFPENMGHNYVYWNSEVKAILSFFSSIK